jgi:hypothetical protein
MEPELSEMTSTIAAMTSASDQGTRNKNNPTFFILSSCCKGASRVSYAQEGDDQPIARIFGIVGACSATE